MQSALLPRALLLRCPAAVWARCSSSLLRGVSTTLNTPPHGDKTVPANVPNTPPARSDADSSTTQPSSQRAADASSSSAGLIPMPQRIILLRHGESAFNRGETASCRMPEWKVPLTRRGLAQARAAGERLRAVVGDAPVYVYHSPYVRAVQTTVEVLRGLEAAQVMGVREEPRMAEQQFGNLQDMAQLRQSIEERVRYGRFFYRFPNGEAGLDVYSRVSGFIGTLRQARFAGPAATVVVVTHGLAIRLFLMRWFQWSVEQFEVTRNPGFCDMAVMELVPGGGGAYRLSDATLDIVGAQHAPTTSPLGRAVYTRAFVDAFLSY